MVWFIARLIRNVRMASGEEWKPVLKPVGEMALEGAGLGALPRMEAAYGGSARIEAPPDLDDLQIPEGEDVMLDLGPKQSPASSKEEEARQEAIAQLTDQNPAAVAEIIQIWLSEDERNG